MITFPARYLATVLLTLTDVCSFSFIKQPCRKTNRGHIPWCQS